MRIFLSQPMGGIVREDIKDKRESMIGWLKSKFPGAVIIDSYFEDFDDQPKSTSIQLLGESIKLLCGADLAVFMPGWNKARGCRIEEAVANAYDIECMYM